MHRLIVNCTKMETLPAGWSVEVLLMEESRRQTERQSGLLVPSIKHISIQLQSNCANTFARAAAATNRENTRCTIIIIPNWFEMLSAHAHDEDA